MYTLGTIEDSQINRMPTKIKKRECCQNYNFSAFRDTVRHLKTFTVISNEMAVSLAILC